MKVTRGSHFNPTDVDLVNILHMRIDRNKQSSFITDMQNLYEREPWLLQHVRHVKFHENEWFYFVRRNKRPGMIKADSKRPSRKVAESGIWKTAGTITQIKNQENVNVASKRLISFKANSETVKDGITTGWTMHEFVLNKPWFQEVVLCRIKFRKRKDNAQYAPRFLPIVIGRERGDNIHHGVGEDMVHQYLEQDMVPMRQCLMVGQSQQLSVTGSIEKHQEFGSNGQQSGEFLGQEKKYILGAQATYVTLMEDNQQQCKNLFGGHGMDPSHSDQTMEEEEHQEFGSYGQLSGEFLGQEQNHILEGQATYVSHMEDNLLGGHETDLSNLDQTMEEVEQQWNGYFGPYLASPYDQGMMEHQDFGSSSLGLAQDHQYLGQNNDLSSQQQHLGEDLNLSGSSQVPVMMNQALEVHADQQYDEYKGHNNELPTVINSAAQLHLEAQDNVPLINQTIEAQVMDLPVNQGIDESHGGIVGSPTYSELAQEFLGDEEMDPEMTDIWNDFWNEEWVQQLGENTPEEEAELMADLSKCETFESFLNFLCPTNNVV